MELDQRADGAILQAILKRLTGRGTVPNVILQVFPNKDLVVLPANEQFAGKVDWRIRRHNGNAPRQQAEAVAARERAVDWWSLGGSVFADHWKRLWWTLYWYLRAARSVFM